MTVGGSGKKNRFGYTPYNCTPVQIKCTITILAVQHAYIKILDSVIFSVLGYVGSKKLDTSTIRKQTNDYKENLKSNFAKVNRKILKLERSIKN